MSLKSLIAIVTAVFVASLGFAATADAAGCNGKRGFSKSAHSSSYYAKKRARAKARARARAKAKARAVAKAKAKARAIAKAKEDSKAEKLANAKTEGTFSTPLSTAALLTEKDLKTDNKDEQPLQKIAANDTKSDAETVLTTTQATGCKRFIPAVGMTVSVECE